MRVAQWCCLIAILSIGTGLMAEDKKEDKIDGKKLVGKWECEGFKEKGITKVIEFAKDGKVVETSADAKGNEKKIEGTYTVDGNKLVITVKVMEKERKITTTISKLTDAELVGIPLLPGPDEKGFETTWVRLKDK